jgi:diketogulonate reductase-like aldo/keto reductase
LRGEECERSVRCALDLGYRHIDTADVYENHKLVGKGIKNWPREEIFLVSKLFSSDLLPEKVASAVPRFLKELATDYLDLLLIHWPFPGVDLGNTLEAMMNCKEKGLVKNIGVSNFVPHHLDLFCPRFPILANQVELHLYFQRKALREACKKHGIAVTAYRPVAKGAFEQDDLLQKIGAKYGKSPSQIALRWLVQQDIAAIPKAANREHLKDNINIFDFSLPEEDMRQLETLDAGTRYCAPSGFPVFEDDYSG